MSEPHPPQEFVEGLLSLRETKLDPAAMLRETPAPRRLAPYSAAVEVSISVDDVMSGTSTMVILYDPDQWETWGGPFRIVGHARMDIDAEQSTDPLLGEAIWNTLCDSLDASGAAYERMIGSVTRELTETFGGLSLSGSSLAAELRCSWSPLDNRLGEHLEGWTEALRQNCGIEPSGVLPIRGRRG